MSVHLYEMLSPHVDRFSLLLSIFKESVSRSQFLVYNYQLSRADELFVNSLASSCRSSITFDSDFSSCDRFFSTPLSRVDGYLSLYDHYIGNDSVIIIHEPQSFPALCCGSDSDFLHMLETHRHFGYDVHFITSDSRVLSSKIKRLIPFFSYYGSLDS